jgi:acetylornithine deacetylase/succinyl-diaminopimelate desuccinylase-like protein
MASTTQAKLTGETVELLQALIRNQCVNDGTPESGFEDRSARLLRDELEGTGVDLQLFEVAPGRTSLIARYRGTDPDAPSICLMGHTDVVPVSPEGWSRDPFGGELIDGEVWGRGAVDMLNLTSSMAVAFRHIISSGKRYPGDIIYFAVADEEAGGVYGAEVLIEEQWDALQCDFVLTEYGGIPIGAPDGPTVLVTTSEKGLGQRRLIVSGEPGHGSMPFATDNALVKAAEIVRRITAYNPKADIDEEFANRVKAMNFGADVEAGLLDPGRITEALTQIDPKMARNLHACCHTTFSPNVIHGGLKTNIIPDKVVLDVDIRTLPGEQDSDIQAHLDAALGEMAAEVTFESLSSDPSSSSPAHTPLWDALAGAVNVAYPNSTLLPSMVTGGTDARFFRRKGVVAYGAGLLSAKVSLADFFTRFHGHDERIDVDSLTLTTQLWLDVFDRLWD